MDNDDGGKDVEGGIQEGQKRKFAERTRTKAERSKAINITAKATMLIQWSKEGSSKRINEETIGSDARMRHVQ
jgi:hypothetical protein